MAGVDLTTTLGVKPWLVAFVLYSTFWLGFGMISGLIWKNFAARAHSILLLATFAGIMSPCIAIVVRQMNWGVLPCRKTVQSIPDSTTRVSIRYRTEYPFDQRGDESSRRPRSEMARWKTRIQSPRRLSLQAPCSGLHRLNPDLCGPG